MAFADHGQLLVAAGSGPAEGSSVKAFDGESWRDLGDLRGEVRGLVSWNGQIHAYGSMKFPDRETFASLSTYIDDTWKPWDVAAPQPIAAATIFGDELCIAGAFRTLADDTLNGIAAWRDGRWQALGGGVGRGDRAVVNSLVIHDGELVAGGRFDRAGTTEAFGVATWDGTRWRPLGDGIFGEVKALASWAGKLYVGGSFFDAGGDTIAGLAVWDGATWGKPGQGLMPRSNHRSIDVQHLVVWQDQLVAGGDFETIDGGIQRIACFDGRSWQEVCGPGEIDCDIKALWAHNGLLLVSARRPLKIVLEESPLVAFDGHQWMRVGGGRFNPPYLHPDIQHRCEFATHFGTPLPLAAMSDSVPGPHEIRFDDVTFWNGKAVVAGIFPQVGGRPQREIRQWERNCWSASIDPPEGYESRKIGLVVADDRLIAYRHPGLGAIVPPDFRQWDGSRWSRLDCGDEDVRLRALTVLKGRLVALLEITSPDGDTDQSCRIRMPGDRWQEVPLPESALNALSVWNGHLVAATKATRGEPARALVQTSLSWDPLPGSFRGPVECLVDYRQTLVAGGYFVAVDSLVCEYVAFFDGSRWGPLGDGLEGSVTSMAASPHSLWCSGHIKKAGPYPSEKIARWDGPLPRNIDHAQRPRYQPPQPRPAPTSIVDGWHSHGVDSIEPAGPFENGDLVRWRDGVPEGWTAEIVCRQGRDRETRLPRKAKGGGIVLEASGEHCWFQLARRFSIAGNKAYRASAKVRVLSTGSSGRDPRVVMQLSDYRRGGSGHEYGPLQGGISVSSAASDWAWIEVDLVTKAGADVGVVSFWGHDAPLTLEIERVEVHRIELSVAQIIDRLLDHLEARLVATPGAEVDWPALRREAHEQAATAELEDARNHVRSLLEQLPASGLATTDWEADVHGFTGFGDVIPRLSPETFADDGRRLSPTRDAMAHALVFSSQLGHVSRDGLLLVQDLRKLEREDWTGVEGVLIDLRGGPRDRNNRYGGSVETLDHDMLAALSSWSRTARDVAIVEHRELEGAQRDTLCLGGRWAAGRVPLAVVLIDHKTVGLKALVAMAFAAMGEWPIVGIPSGAPDWPSAWIPLACGQRVYFPAAKIYWPDGRNAMIDQVVHPSHLVEDSTPFNDGVDPIFERGLEILREMVVDRGVRP